MSKKINVTVWNEFRHEKSHEAVKAVYPTGMHVTIAEFLSKEPDMTVRTATLDEPEHGLTDEVLAKTDVLTWWGHMAHGEVRDEIVAKVHSARAGRHGPDRASTPATSPRSTSGSSGATAQPEVARGGEKERLWVVMPGHPIVAGLGEYIELPHTEMYGEFFDIPQPDELVFISWFEGGEVFRSGCCYHRGRGKIVLLPPRPRDLPHLQGRGGPARHHQRRALGGPGGRPEAVLRQRQAAGEDRRQRTRRGARASNARAQRLHEQRTTNNALAFPPL